MATDTTIQIPYHPRPLQREFAKRFRKARFGVLVCHRRWGKTLMAVNLLQQGALMCQKPRPRFAYIAPTYRMGKQISWDYMQYYARPIPAVQFNQSELRADYPNQGQVRIYGADSPDGMRGIYLDGATFDEYGMQPAKTYTEVVAATLVDRGGTALFLGTPNGKNQFFEIWRYAHEQQMKGDPDWVVAEYKASQTGLLDEEYLAQARAVMTPDEYAQEFECFPAGTFIATSRGNIPIELMRVGDTVLTHRNRWRPVTRWMAREHDGELVCVKAFGHQRPIRCTPEHPFLVYDKASRKRSWKPARDLAVGDCLLTPKASMGARVISEDMARLVAWFICEGSVSGNALYFSLNPKKQSEIDRVADILARCGYKSHWQGGNLYVCDVALADRLVAWCGSGARSKRIPFDVISGHESAVFDELMLGDGCSVESVQGGHRWAYTTISQGLAFDVSLLAAALGRRTGIITRPPHQTTIRGRLVNQQASYLVQIPKGTKVNHGSVRDAFPTKLGIAYRVREVSREAWSGTVYNLSVKGDESYVANGRAVHNCSFEASVRGAIYARELESAREAGRVTRIPYESALPVDTDWDLGIGDATAIWFSQRTRTGEVRLIDYYESSGEALPHYIGVLQQRGYVYGEHWAPHDIQVRELGSGKSRLETAAALGIKFRVTPNIGLEDGISAARMVLPRCWFDAEKCKHGLDAMMHYRRSFNERLGEFKAVPVHDHSSHGADAFRGLAVRLKPPKDAATARDTTRRSVPSGTGWMAG